MVTGDLWISADTASGMNVMWKINTFFSHYWKPGECVTSLKFNYGNFSCKISALPKGTEQKKDSICFYVLCFWRNHPKMKLSFQLALKTDDGLLYEDATQKETYNTRDSVVHVCDFPQTFARERSTSSGNLTVSCKLIMEEIPEEVFTPDHTETATHAEIISNCSEVSTSTESASHTEVSTCTESASHTEVSTCTESASHAEVSTCTESASHAEVSTCTESFSHAEVSTCTDPPNCSEAESPVLFTPSNDLMQDFSNLHINGEDSDVTIRVHGENFQVHRSIFDVRAPVFASELQQKLSTTDINTISMNDLCGVSAFNAFLHFVYHGEMKSVSREAALELYVLADKYNLAELKQQSLKYMKRNKNKLITLAA